MLKFMPVGTCVFPHPYLRSGLLVARVAVIVSTFLWGLLLVIQKDAMAALPYEHFQRLAGEDFWGVVAITVAASQWWRTQMRYEPSVAGFILNALMAYLWTYITLGRIMQMHPIPPAGFAACAMMMVLSWWNLVGLPKRMMWHGQRTVAFTG